MTQTIIPHTSWPFPQLHLPSWFEETEWTLNPLINDGLTISEDDKKVYVEAAVPGIDPEKLEITLDKGVLWIRGEGTEEEKNRKYYRKATQSYSYRTTLPAEVEAEKELKAQCKNGVVHIAFSKTAVSQPKRISVSG